MRRTLNRNQAHSEWYKKERGIADILQHPVFRLFWLILPVDEANITNLNHVIQQGDNLRATGYKIQCA